MVKAVIFDMDGLMFDTEKLARKNMKKAGACYGYEFTDSIMLSMIGKNVRDCKDIIIMHFGEDFPHNAVKAKVHEYKDEYLKVNGVPKKKGLLQILDYCKSKHLKIAVATSTHRNMAERLLKLADIINYFDTIVCGDDVEKGKPNPEIYLTACANLGVKPEECVVLEDSKYGIQGANSANMQSIFVPDLVPECDVIRSNATTKCKSLDLAIPIIEKWSTTIDK